MRYPRRTPTKDSTWRGFPRAWRALGAIGAAALLAPALVAGGASTAHARTPTAFTVVILPFFASGTPLDVSGGSTRAGADIVSSPADGRYSQRWKFLPQRGVRNQYEIENVHSGLCLTTNGIPGRPVEQQKCRDHQYQRWNIELAQTPLLAFRSAWRGPAGRLYLSAQRYAYNGGTKFIATYSGGPSAKQLFVFGPLPGPGLIAGLGEYLSDGGFGVLDVSGASQQAGAGVILSTPFSPLRTNQMWTFVDEGGYNYELKNYHSGKCLTTDGNLGDQVEQQPCLGHLNQLWFTGLNVADSKLPIGSDYYGKHGYLALESQGASPQAGDIADTWTYNGGSNQLFVLILRSP